MPPKQSSLAVTQRASNDKVQDQWSANPFKSTDPRHEQYEVQQRIAQREAAVSRVGHAIAKDLRTHDFSSIGGVVMGRNTTAADYNAKQQKKAAAADGSMSTVVDANGRSVSVATAASPFDDSNTLTGTNNAHNNGYVNTTGDLTAVPSRLELPKSYVEESIPIEGLTCSTVLQGGSLVLVGTRGGDVIALNGFTNRQLMRVSVTDAVPRCDRELTEDARAEGRDANKRPLRKAKAGDASAHSAEMSAKIAAAAEERETKSASASPTEDPFASRNVDGEQQKTGGDGSKKETRKQADNEGAYPIAVSALGESSYVAFVLSNNKVRVFDAMSLLPVDEISLETEEEKEKRQAEAEKGATPASDAAAGSDASTNGKEGDEPLPFAAVLPIDCALDPIIFFIATRDRLVALNLHQPDSLADRPRLTITKIKTFEKLGLKLVSAATDCARTVVYIGDAKGEMWSVDVSDLMVIDNWPVVPPPPAPPNTKSEQRRAKAAASLQRGQPSSSSPSGPIELATAIGAFNEYIFAGSSAGRVVVLQKQPFGEKPLPIIDEVGAHKRRIVGAAADERSNAVWFASEDGEVTCWSLLSQVITYRTTVPVGTLLTSFAMLPHAITNKIWTITISGINKVWVTEDHQTHDEMNVTHAHMEGVLTRQELAMQQKEDEVELAENMMLTRLHKIVDAMAEQNRQRIQRAYYCAWVTARLKAITRRKREDAADALNNSCVFHLGRTYYLKLVANMTAQRARKQNEATILHLRTQREDELRGRYFNSLRKYIHERRTAEHKDAVAVAVAGINHASSVLPFYMDTWRRFADRRRKAHEQQRYLKMIGRVEDRKRAFHFFMQWLKVGEKARLKREQAKVVSIVGHAANFRTSKEFFARWRALLAVRKAYAQRQLWASFISACYDRILRQSAFTALQRYSRYAVRAREEKAMKAAEEQKAGLETSFATIAPIVDRKDKIKALKEKLAALNSTRKTLEKDEAAVSRHNGELRERISSVPNPILDGVSNPQRAALLKLMGRLRAAIINSEYDAVVINKVLAKAKADTVLATFEGYLTDLKATVLIPPTAVPTASTRSAANNANNVVDSNECSVKSIEGGRRTPPPALTSSSSSSWPKGEAAVMRLVASVDPLMQAPLLQTLKSLVISFDAMSVGETETLYCAEELISNGETIALLAELLFDAVAKRKALEPSPHPTPARERGAPPSLSITKAIRR